MSDEGRGSDATMLSTILYCMSDSVRCRIVRDVFCSADSEIGSQSASETELDAQGIP